MNNNEIYQTFMNGIPLYNKNLPIILYWSPKSGCTTIMKWFYYQSGELSEALNMDNWIHTYRSKIQDQFYREELVTSLLSNQKATYKLVRDPYKRAVSSFYSTLIGTVVRDNLSPKITTGLSFKEFLYYIKERGVQPGQIDPHISQQYLQGEEDLINHYVKLEDLKSELKKIEKKFNLPKSPIKDLSKSPHHFLNYMKGSGRHAETKLPLDFDGDLPSYESLYDAEAIQLVTELYKEDFEVYGYSMKGL
ncbi:sulfotransferase family 2 domain-containing protein [Cytobacillus kochii]|uniref:sulfotransferase family 2 domain-containing protein n=1 Tax=Cytobacillus kochii TaxID=859143 RepID=UPI00203B810B|nr:sulfotransferase family 2 domain-containing protein [Cytobacillus kochii]MCM3324227.1 sulfotransferase family protein [Cytobacillus kochii]MCM3346704.1 sulfotransferase family protein [Cytobacillus kochii]